MFRPPGSHTFSISFLALSKMFAEKTGIIYFVGESHDDNKTKGG
jgi:hypothetical protein